MADDYFTLSKAIIPEVFTDYTQEVSTKTNRFIQSGITTSNFDIGNQLLQPGNVLTMPYINDLSGAPQVWNDKHDIEVDSTSTGTQYGFKFAQVKSFGRTDWSKIYSGAPIDQVIASRFGAYWARVDQHQLLNVVKGTLSNDDIANEKVFDDSSNNFSARGFLATIAKMGDLQDNAFSVIAVNSAAYAQMKANQMIDTTTPQNTIVSPFGTYDGMRILVDDDIPLEGQVATSYIFRTGSVGYKVATPENAVEVFREPSKQGGRTSVINRRLAATHVMGTTLSAKALGTINDEFDPEKLTDGTMWDCVVDPRKIGIVAYKSKIDTDFIPKKKATSATPSTSGSGSSSSTPTPGK